MSQSQNKTAPTNVDVSDFLETIDEQKQHDSHILIDMMRAISGYEPVMWGPSIIGFGSQHYHYESGREGDVGIFGFSPRKTALTVYFMEGFDAHSDLLDKLGKYTHSVSCLYIRKLSDIDLDVLRQMLERSFLLATTKREVASDMNSYIASAPEPQQTMMEQIRALVHDVVPDAVETISYQIPAFKLDGKPLVYFASWLDHVSVYPIPKTEPELEKVLQPYVKGKGTLWFSLNETLPIDLIRRLVHAHVARVRR